MSELVVIGASIILLNYMRDKFVTKESGDLEHFSWKGLYHRLQRLQLSITECHACMREI